MRSILQRNLELILDVSTAPNWYESMKTLANMYTMLANHVDKDQIILMYRNLHDIVLTTINSKHSYDLYKTYKDKDFEISRYIQRVKQTGKWIE